MHISPSGIEILKQLEGLFLEATRSEGEWRIGYGHRAGVDPGDTITETEAEALLEKDLKRASRMVFRAVGDEIPQAQFDALVLFGYSMGLQLLADSTLMAAVIARDAEAAVEEFHKWSRKLGETSTRLAQRRQCEAALFQGQIDEAKEIAAIQL